MAVLDGNTLKGYVPRTMPFLVSACTQQSQFELISKFGTNVPLSISISREAAYNFDSCFIKKFNEGKSHGRVWVTTHTAVYHLSTFLKQPGQLLFCDLFRSISC